MGFEPINSASQSEGGKVMEIDWGKKFRGRSFKLRLISPLVEYN